MYFDRRDVAEAHYWFAVNYHGGQSSELYAKQCRISQYFKPGILANGPSSENACMIYNNLELKHGHKRTHYKMLPCGAARLVESR
jgi:hypothetical protein